MSWLSFPITLFWALATSWMIFTGQILWAQFTSLYRQKSEKGRKTALFKFNFYLPLRWDSLIWQMF